MGEVASAPRRATSTNGSASARPRTSTRTRGISNAAAAAYEAEGFEISIHVNTNCSDWTPGSLADFYSSQLADFAANFPSLSSPATHRTHCITWSDWASQPKVELDNGIRFDTNYYYWPAAWVQNRPGYFTGSGMPMRFADLDGSLIDVYQAATQMPDESGLTYATHINTLLDNAIGAPGYYGVVTTNMHTDSADHAGQKAVVNAALARGVPVVSARQMLTWLDGRNASSFANLDWNAGTLTFSIARGRRVQRPPGDAPDPWRERLTPGPDARRQPRHHLHRDDQGHRVRGLRRDRRELHGDVRRRHDAADDHRRRRRVPTGVPIGTDHGHVDDRRARARSRVDLRHRARRARPQRDRQRRRDDSHAVI